LRTALTMPLNAGQRRHIERRLARLGGR
jgi:hypothetical protein